MCDVWELLLWTMEKMLVGMCLAEKIDQVLKSAWRSLEHLS